MKKQNSCSRPNIVRTRLWWWWSYGQNKGSLGGNDWVTLLAHALKLGCSLQMDGSGMFFPLVHCHPTKSWKEFGVVSLSVGAVPYQSIFFFSNLAWARHMKCLTPKMLTMEMLESSVFSCVTLPLLYDCWEKNEWDLSISSRLSLYSWLDACSKERKTWSYLWPFLFHFCKL